MPPPKGYENPDVIESNELHLKSTGFSINDIIQNNNLSNKIKDNIQRESYENDNKEYNNLKNESVPLKYLEKNNNNIDEDENENFLLEQEKRRQERIQKEKKKEKEEEKKKY